MSSADFRSVVMQKEKELQDVFEIRIKKLEKLVAEKDNELNDETNRFKVLKDDFQYNLKLLEQRDQELERYDAQFEQLKSSIRDRDAEVSELRVVVAETQSEVKQVKAAAAEQENHFRSKINESRAALENQRFTKDEEIRRLKEEFETGRHNLQMQLQEKVAEMEAQRVQMNTSWEELVRTRENEFNTREQDAKAVVTGLQQKLQAVSAESEQRAQQLQNAVQSFEQLREKLRESEKNYQSLQWEAEDSQRLQSAKIHDLEVNVANLQASKQELLDGYEAKMRELLAHLHQCERGFVQQKDEYEIILSKQANEKDETWKTAVDRLHGRIELLSQQLKSTETELERTREAYHQYKVEAEGALRKKELNISNLEADTESSRTRVSREIEDLKKELWNRDQEASSLRDKLDIARRSLEERREDIGNYKAELTKAADREAQLKRDLLQQNLRWEQELERKEKDLTAANERVLTSLQSQRDDYAAAASESDRRSAQYASDLQDYEEANARLDGRLKDREQTLEEVENELSETKAEVHRLRAELRSSENARAEERNHLGGTGGQGASTNATGPAGGASLSTSAMGGVGLSIDADLAATRSNVFGDPIFSPLRLPSPLSSPARSRPGTARSPSRVSRQMSAGKQATARAELETQNERLREVIAQMRTDMENLTHAGVGADSNVVFEKMQLQSQVQTQQEHIATLERRLSDFTTSGIETHHEELKFLRGHSEEMNETNARIRNELAEARTEIDGLRRELVSKEEELTSRQEQIIALRKQLEDAADANLALGKESKEKDGLINQLADDLEDADDQINTQQQTTPLSSRTQRLATRDDEVERLRDRLASMEAEAQSLAMDNERLRTKLSEAAGDLKRLMNEREKLIELSNQLKADLNKAVGDRRAAATALNEAENRLAENDRRTRELNKQNTTLRQEIEAWTSDAPTGYALNSAASGQEGHLRRTRTAGSYHAGSAAIDDVSDIPPTNGSIAGSRDLARELSLDGGSLGVDDVPTRLRDTSPYRSPGPERSTRVNIETESARKLLAARAELELAGTSSRKSVRTKARTATDKLTLSQRKARERSVKRQSLASKRKAVRNYAIPSP